MDQLISYNSDQLVKDRLKNWNAGEFDLTYTMRSGQVNICEIKNNAKNSLLFNYTKLQKFKLILMDAIITID
jgi:hypothetical protein